PTTSRPASASRPARSSPPRPMPMTTTSARTGSLMRQATRRPAAVFPTGSGDLCGVPGAGEAEAGVDGEHLGLGHVGEPEAPLEAADVELLGPFGRPAAKRPRAWRS